MVDGIQVKIDGIKELQNTFKLLDKDMPDILSKAVSQGAAVVERDAKIRVHRITGNLMRSIKELKKVETATRCESQVGSDMSYANAEEYRVDGSGSHAYLRPALDNNEAQIKAAIEQAIATRLARYGK